MEMKWQYSPPGGSPTTLVETLENTNPVLYPNANAVLTIVLIMLVSAATPESSFSSMGRVKTYLGATMKMELLSSLALMHAYHKINIDMEAVACDLYIRKNRLLNLGFQRTP